MTSVLFSARGFILSLRPVRFMGAVCAGLLKKNCLQAGASCLALCLALAVCGATAGSASANSTGAQPQAELLMEAPAEPLAGPEAEAVLARLEAGAAGLKSLKCSFVQEKHLAMFARTLRSEGLLAFTRPDALRWEYRSPVNSGFIIRGGKGFVWSGAGGVESRSALGENREFSTLSQQVMLWLAFDAGALRRQYHVDVLSVAPVTVRMTPRSELVRGFLQHISIEFDQETLVARQVRIQENDEEYTLIRFSDAELNRPLPEALFTP